MVVVLPPFFIKNSQTLTFMKEKDKRRLRKIAANLTKIRESKDLSIRELATRCDVDHSKISKIENNKVNLMVTTLMELADGLGVHPKKLLDFDIED
jgi:transcriptional regulator with XRE-family HTH domain